MNMEDRICEAWITLDDGTELHCDRHPGHITAHRCDQPGNRNVVWRWKGDDAKAAWASVATDAEDGKPMVGFAKEGE